MILYIGADIIVNEVYQFDNDGRNPHDGKNSTRKPNLDLILG